MRGDQNLVGRRSGHDELAVGQRTLGQACVDEHVVFAGTKAGPLLVRQAKAPVVLVVARPIRNE